MMFVEGKSSARPRARSAIWLRRVSLHLESANPTTTTPCHNPLEPLLDSKGLVPTVDDVLSITREYL
jgi:hypothetical protein